MQSEGPLTDLQDLQDICGFIQWIRDRGRYDPQMNTGWALTPHQQKRHTCYQVQCPTAAPSQFNEASHTKIASHSKKGLGYLLREPENENIEHTPQKGLTHEEDIIDLKQTQEGEPMRAESKVSQRNWLNRVSRRETKHPKTASFGVPTRPPPWPTGGPAPHGPNGTCSCRWQRSRSAPSIALRRRPV